MSFLNKNGTFFAIEPAKLEQELPVGFYRFTMDYNTGARMFKSFEMVSDEIIDVPSKTFDKIVGQTSSFLSEDTKNKFKRLGFSIRRNTLLHGEPGTGKSVLIKKIAKEVVSKGGIVVDISDINWLTPCVEEIRNRQPDQFILIILEELDRMVGNGNVDKLGNFMCGSNQVENIMVLGTTNYLDQIPTKLLRPSRFSSTLEMGPPSTEARIKYLEHKFKGSAPQALVEASEGLTIDQLKELVLATECLDEPLDEALDRVKSSQTIMEEGKQKRKEEHFSEMWKLRQTFNSMSTTPTESEENHD